MIVRDNPFNMNQIVSLFLVFLLWSCADRPANHLPEKSYVDVVDFAGSDTLFRIPAGEYEPGADFCYVDQRGDTIVPYGQFSYSFTDTIVTFGIVMESAETGPELVGINQKGQRLYEVYLFDNGPDYVEEGMFRIKRNGKTGFADTAGQIVIAPQFECAYPFSGGKAKVAYDCTLTTEADHTDMKSESRFYIDQQGRKIN